MGVFWCHLSPRYMLKKRHNLYVSTIFLNSMTFLVDLRLARQRTRIDVLLK
jgi:hypothetical protein